MGNLCLLQCAIQCNNGNLDIIMHVTNHICDYTYHHTTYTSSHGTAMSSRLFQLCVRMCTDATSTM